MDLKSFGKWNDYTVARDAMFEATSTGWAPWHVPVTDDKKRGRLNVITHLLSQIPHRAQPPREIALPKRTTKAKKAPLDLAPFTIPAPF
jgi:hypothetical protein